MKKKIKLPNGLFLEVFVTPVFLSRVREHFDLQPSDDINDDHIRRFIYGAVDSAVGSAELDLKKSS